MVRIFERKERQKHRKSNNYDVINFLKSKKLLEIDVHVYFV